MNDDTKELADTIAAVLWEFCTRENLTTDRRRMAARSLEIALEALRAGRFALIPRPPPASR